MFARPTESNNRRSETGGTEVDIGLFTFPLELGSFGCTLLTLLTSKGNLALGTQRPLSGVHQVRRF